VTQLIFEVLVGGMKNGFQNGVFLFQRLKQAAGFIEIGFYFLSNYFPLKERG
jgi:hypothetical protein